MIGCQNRKHPVCLKTALVLILNGVAILGLTIAASAHNPLPGPSFTLQEMVILTDGDILLGGKFDVEEGNICSRNGQITVGGKAPVRIPVGAPSDTSSDVIAATGNIVLKNWAKVGHTRGNVVVSGTTGIQTNLQDAAMPCPANPPFPSFSVSSEAVDDIVCTSAGMDIPPGDYRDLIVQYNGKCNFRGPGDYNFRRVITTTSSHYQFNFLDRPDTCSKRQPFNLNVKEFMFLGQWGDFNATVTPPVGETPSVSVYVEGSDGKYGGRNPAPNGEAFYYRGQGRFIACRVFAINGTIRLIGSHHDYHTQWIGKAFRQDVLKVSVAFPLSPECCFPTRECSCFIDFFNLTDQSRTVAQGGTLLLTGKGFRPETVTQVLFYAVGNNSVDFTDPAAAADCTVSNADPDFSFVSERVISLKVPAGCAAGNYHLGVVNDGFCVERVLEVTITP